MIFEKHTLSELLQDELDRRVSVNPSYSLRAFARALKMSPGELSELMRGKRAATYRQAARVTEALALNAAEAEHVLGLVRQAREGRWATSSQTAAPPPAFEARLEEDLFRLVSEWQHFAILNLMGCKGFVWNHSYISRRLGITLAQAKAAMRQLLKLGLVEKTRTGFRAARDRFFGPDQVPSQAIRRYHQQILEKAQQALALQSVAERDISGVGFACRRRDIPAIKKEISRFQDALMNRYGSNGTGDEVYQLEVAFFRITEGEEKHGNS